MAGRILTIREQWQTEEVEKLLSACYRQFSLLRSYCFNVTSFLASLHGIFWCRLQTVYVWRKSSAWSSSELKLIDAFVLPKTALHVNKLGLLERLDGIKIRLLGRCITIHSILQNEAANNSKCHHWWRDPDEFQTLCVTFRKLSRCWRIFFCNIWLSLCWKCQPTVHTGRLKDKK